MFRYDDPFDINEFLDEYGNELDKNKVPYDQILDYWKEFIDTHSDELQVKIPRTGGRKSTKKKSKKSSKKKSKKARQSRKARRNY